MTIISFVLNFNAQQKKESGIKTFFKPHPLKFTKLKIFFLLKFCFALFVCSVTEIKLNDFESGRQIDQEEVSKQFQFILETTFGLEEATLSSSSTSTSLPCGHCMMVLTNEK